MNRPLKSIGIPINWTLLMRTWRTQRLRLVAVCVALMLWGGLMPIIYASFGSTLRDLVEANPLFRQFTEIGNANLFTLRGSIAVGFIHPIAIALIGVFAIGFGSVAIAGERQRGTLEVLLARPVARSTVYSTVLVAMIVLVALSVLALIVGTVVGAMLAGVLDELRIRNLFWLWLNGTLLFTALGSLALASSVSFDRLGPAAAATLAIVLVSYLLEVLGSLWPDAEPLQPYSLFHYLRPRRLLGNGFELLDASILGVVVVVAVGYSLVVFRRRDLAAPS